MTIDDIKEELFDLDNPEEHAYSYFEVINGVLAVVGELHETVDLE